MDINENIVKKIENLSSLKLEDDERAEAAKDISDIISYIDVIKEVKIPDTSSSNIEIAQNNLRKDEIIEKAGDVITNLKKSANDDSFFAVKRK